MAFDIYGNYLSHGHCEVHPWVHEEWPCPVCMQENKHRADTQREYELYCQEQYDEYCKEVYQHASIETERETLLWAAGIISEESQK